MRNRKKKKADIAYQNKDVASKVMGEALEGKSLAAFGLPEIKIVRALPTNLPAVESNELRLDHLFLLEDGAVGIIDYESDYSEENFVKYLNYAARVIRRYARKKQLGRLKSLKIIVIYTADVDEARRVYDLGGVTVRVETAYLVGQDTEGIYRGLKETIESGKKLNDEEQLQLMILPLTVKGKENKQRLAVRAVELAKRIKDRREETEALAGILTFADKVIDEECRRRIKEEIEMTQVGKMIYDDGVKAGTEIGKRIGTEIGREIGKKIGTEIGTKIGFSQGENSMLVDLVCRKVRRGKKVEEIAEDLEKELDIIREICRAAEQCGSPYDCRKVLEIWKKN